ncbi:MAG: AmmeMemoRadiSam system protein B [Deltaproteobacteria bacterium]|nr:AmmeMemoRadiSam system protein B [Deltaproteobacteria bacterium]
MARKPAVAGTFYDSDTSTLRRTVESLLKTRPPTGVQNAVGLVAPHAAYMYSGAVAGRAYASIRVPDRVIILAPNHTGLGMKAAVGLDGPWDTPLGSVEVDHAFGRRLIQASDELVEDELAHLEEHAVEVHLPFLQSVNPSVSIVPICLRTMSYALCESIGKELAGVLEGEENRPLLIASSDMNHHEPQKVATRKDRMALERVAGLDPKGLYQVVVDHHVSMCGFVPTVIMMIAAKALGVRHAEIMSYTTSGDVNGDYSSVVGYAGVILATGKPAVKPLNFASLD